MCGLDGFGEGILGILGQSMNDERSVGMNHLGDNRSRKPDI
jgi:hypothetical protein